MNRRAGSSSASIWPSASRAETPEAGTEAGVALMVVRLHVDLGSENTGEAASRLDLDLVLRELAGRLLVLLVPDQVRQVLDQIAAERDVQHLRAAADREHRQVAFERRA